MRARYAVVEFAVFGCLRLHAARCHLRNDVDHLLDNLKRGEFQIDCLWMELVRASDGKKFEGSGYIRQNPTRHFEAKIYSSSKVELREVFEALATNNAGKLYGDDDFYTLSATDDSHRKWTAERITNPR